MGVLEVGLALGAGALVKWWSKKKGKSLHKVGSPVAALLVGALANELGIELPMDQVLANQELMELLSGGAGAVLLHSLANGAKQTAKQS